ncbi:MAG: DUF3500 domain-containing protein [Marinicella sp.]
MVALTASIDVNANSKIQEISALGLKIKKQVEATNEINFPVEIIKSDLYENAYLPINLQIRKDSVGFEQSDIKIRRQIHELISQVLSNKGYSDFVLNLELGKHLEELIGKDTDHVFKFYGAPDSGYWGFKFEGYHLSISFLIKDFELQFINYFLGQDFDQLSKTAIKSESIYNEGVQIGKKLMSKLSSKKLGQSYLSINTPQDIMTNPNQSFLVMDDLGLSSEALNRKQLPLFISWLSEYFNQFSDSLISPLLEINEDEDHENFHIIWSGNFKAEDGELYYLIYNENTIIEHSFKNNHLHSIIRLKF